MIVDHILTETEYILEYRTPNSGKEWAEFSGCKPFLRGSLDCALDLLSSVRSKGYPLFSPVKHLFRLVKLTAITDYNLPDSATQHTRTILDY